MTGAGATEEGNGTFTAGDGSISNRTVAAQPHSKLVQAWRTSELPECASYEQGWREDSFVREVSERVVQAAQQAREEAHQAVATARGQARKQAVKKVRRQATRQRKPASKKGKARATPRKKARPPATRRR